MRLFRPTWRLVVLGVTLAAVKVGTAATPAGPPPTTSTSTSAATGVRRGASCTTGRAESAGETGPGTEDLSEVMRKIRQRGRTRRDAGVKRVRGNGLVVVGNAQLRRSHARRVHFNSAGAAKFQPLCLAASTWIKLQPPFAPASAKPGIVAIGRGAQPFGHRLDGPALARHQQPLHVARRRHPPFTASKPGHHRVRKSIKCFALRRKSGAVQSPPAIRSSPKRNRQSLTQRSNASQPALHGFEQRRAVEGL